MEILLTFVIISMCFGLLSLGWVLGGKKIKGSCGGLGIVYKGEEIECGICGKKGEEIATCDRNDDSKPAPKDQKTLPGNQSK